MPGLESGSPRFVSPFFRATAFSPWSKGENHDALFLSPRLGISDPFDLTDKDRASPSSPYGKNKDITVNAIQILKMNAKGPAWTKLPTCRPEANIDSTPVDERLIFIEHQQFI
jgi:hypothetical protein